MDTQEIAQQLTLIEYRLYSKIRVQECWEWGRTGGMLHDFMSTHDRLASWVKTTILNLPRVVKRAEMIDFWITCAEVCRRFRKNGRSNIDKQSADRNVGR